jgi:transcriptional regulator with XRE-family HTH domain
LGLPPPTLASLYYKHVVDCQEGTTEDFKTSWHNKQERQTRIEGKSEMPSRIKNRGPFAQRLVNLRKARGLSQVDLASKTGVSPRMIAHYETFIKNPSADILLRIGRTLGVTVDQLMGRRSVKVEEEISRKTLKNAKLLEELPPEDQKAISRMINRFRAVADRKT